MLGQRSKLMVVLDVLVVASAVVRVLAGLEPFHSDTRSTRPERHATTDHWDLQRLPPVEDSR